MREIIYEEIESKSINSNGFCSLELPTGRGKSFIVIKWISGYMQKCREQGILPRKIFYITPQLKNIPFDKLQELYYDRNKFLQDVLLIEKNDAVFLDEKRYSKIKKQIPKEIKDFGEYQNLETCLHRRNIKLSTKATNPHFKTEIAEIENEIYKNERSFRDCLYGFLRKQLSEEIKDKYEIKEALRLLINTKYKWIRELYPAMTTDEHSVFMLSMSKFIYGNSTIIEPNYKFINNAITENAIIFFDEWDSTKPILENIMIKKAAGISEDEIALFKDIRNGFRNEFGRPLMLTCNAPRVRMTFEKMQNKADELYNTYFLGKCFQITDEYVDMSQTFMFHDDIMHTVSSNRKSCAIGRLNKETNKIDIEFITYDEFEKLKQTKEIINIDSMINNIDKFFREFRFFVKHWAERYVKFKSKNTENLQTIISLQNAVYTILDVFNLTGDQQNLLMENNIFFPIFYNDEKEPESLEELLPDLSYYRRGFDFYHYEDAQRHDQTTKIKNIQKHDTAEKYILNLCKKAFVFGISATATLETIDNYNHSYLTEYLGDNYFEISNDTNQKIQKIEDDLCEEYKRVGIRIEPVILNNQNQARLVDFAHKYLKETEARMFVQFLENECKTDAYILNRYLDITEAMFRFWTSKDSHAWLFLNTPLLSNESNGFREKVIRTIFEFIVNSTGIKVGEGKDNIIVVLRSSDSFEEDKKSLMDDLSDGKRRMVFSSYATLMAGQNLDYPVNPNNLDETSVKVRTKICNESDSRFRSKDFDGIVLGDITHQSYNKDFENPKTVIEQRIEQLDLCSKTEHALANYVITGTEFDQLLKYYMGVENNDGSNFHIPLNKINNSYLVSNKILQIVMQSIGRITRTNVKNHTINILITAGVLSKIDKNEISRHILTPELKIFEQLCSPNKEKSDENNLISAAEKKCRQANGFITSLLTKDEDGGFYENNIVIWKNTRDDTLRYPTRKDYHKFSCFYFDAGKDINKYLFVQKKDFKSIKIALSETRDEFIINRDLRTFFDNEPLLIQNVSEEDCRLKTLMKCKGLKEFFEQNGYATSFIPNKFIMVPVIYQNIYKGALGEVAGKYFFEQILNIKLNEITDRMNFELFDFTLADDVYVDFKHWRTYYSTDSKKMYEKISKKLDICSGRRVYIVNVIADKDYKFDETADKRIVVIPNLLNEETGEVNTKVLDIIRKQDFEGVKNDN